VYAFCYRRGTKQVRWHRSAARKATLRTIKERADVAVDMYRITHLLDFEDAHARNYGPALTGVARALACCVRAMDERVMLTRAR